MSKMEYMYVKGGALKDQGLNDIGLDMHCVR